MQSDKQLYLIFEAKPQWIFKLTKLKFPGPCSFQSVICKALERRLDGLLVPEEETESLWVVELQMQFDRGVYNRTTVEMALIQQEYKWRGVEGLIIFFSEELDPKTPPWDKIIHAFYLTEMLDELKAVEPGHPMVALFQPLVEVDEKLLERHAAEYYTTIKSSEPADVSSSRLLDIFVNWLEQRFQDRGKREIEEMLLGKLPDLRDTQSGKDLIAIGVLEGIEQGIEQGIEKGELIGQVLLLERLLHKRPTSRQKLESQSLKKLRAIVESLTAQLPPGLIQ